MPEGLFLVNNSSIPIRHTSIDALVFWSLNISQIPKLSGGPESTWESAHISSREIEVRKIIQSTTKMSWEAVEGVVRQVEMPYIMSTSQGR